MEGHVLSEKLNKLVTLRTSDKPYDIGDYNILVREILEALISEQYNVSIECAKALIDAVYYAGR